MNRTTRTSTAFVTVMTAGLVPGSLIQFWNASADFETIKARRVALDGLESYGHSPVFLDYLRNGAGNVTGLRLLDQYGATNRPQTGVPGNRRLGRR